MKIKISALIVLSFVFCFSLIARAAENNNNGSVYIPKETTISESLYTKGENITIDGNISGDLVAIAQTITINGHLDGDLIAIAQDIFVNGSIGGSVRVISNSLIVDGTIDRNLTSINSHLALKENSKITWDTYFIGSRLEINGIIDGNVNAWSQDTVVLGKIGKNLRLKVANQKSENNLQINAGAIVNGDVEYASSQTANISSQANIAGEIKKQSWPVPEKQSKTLNYLWSLLFSVFSAIIVGLVLVFLLPITSQNILEKILKNPLKSLLYGPILMFILPPIVIILSLTIIGLPLALIIGALWLIGLYVAKILSALLFGQLLIKKFNLKNPASLFWSMILGIILAWILFSIPFIGWLIGLVVAWLGLGGIYLYVTGEPKNI